MTQTAELKILDDKMKANQAQYNLIRETGKISALSSKELDKDGYFTDKDLEYKPGLVEEAKLEQSPLGKAFNKGLEKEDKKERLLKRLMESRRQVERTIESN